LKISFEQEGSSLDGVGFGLGELTDHISPSAKVSVIGELSVNEWNNMRKPQIFVQDLSVRQWQLFDWRGSRKPQQFAASLPQKKTKWIVFQEENVIQLQKHIENEQILWVSSVEQAEKTVLDLSNVVLYDLPSNKKLIVSLLSGKQAARVYVHFYKKESDFFSTMPTRDHFKWYYALLLKRNPFDLKRYGNDLAKHRGWTRETVDFMSKVFFELDFVTMNNGLITLNKNVPKRDLAESDSYQEKHSQIQLEKDLLYSSYPQLKNWFDQIIHGTVKFEEAESKNGLKKVY
jgi:single-stranded-DNA-specific exonuclease